MIIIDGVFERRMLLELVSRRNTYVISELFSAQCRKQKCKSSYVMEKLEKMRL